MVAVLCAGVGTAVAAGQQATHSSGDPTDLSVSIPSTIGLTEAQAVRALAEARLVANVRWASDASRTGEVLRSEPRAGTDVAIETIVDLDVARKPRLPPARQEQEGEIIPFSKLIERNHETFVGLYLDEAGIPHAVFGPGVDPEAWRDRLTAAAQGITYPAPHDPRYLVDACSRTRKRLETMQHQIVSDQSWNGNRRVAFSVVVEPSTCSVRVTSDLLTRSEMRALVDRYGTALSFNTTKGSHPVLTRP